MFVILWHEGLLITAGEGTKDEEKILGTSRDDQKILPIKEYSLRKKNNCLEELLNKAKKKIFETGRDHQKILQSIHFAKELSGTRPLLWIKSYGTALGNARALMENMRDNMKRETDLLVTLEECRDEYRNVMDGTIHALY